MSDEVNKPLLVAVSGGIDSMVLLDLLVSQNITVIVAHVDHGIREDGEADRELVENYAHAHNLQFTTTQLQLGKDADEALAREKRYAWLESERARLGATKIATAHHMDDVIETILLNLRRGTGWRGLCSLRADGEILRPLIGIGMTKTDVVRYAIEHDLPWREDSTNDDLRYTRNFIRYGAAARLTGDARKILLELYAKQCDLRRAIDSEVTSLVEPGQPFARYPLIMCDDASAEELIQAWLGEPQERPTLKRILHFAKTAAPGTKLSFGPDTFIEANMRQVFVSRPRD